MKYLRLNVLPKAKEDTFYMTTLLIYWQIMYWYYFNLLLPVLHEENTPTYKFVYLTSVFVANNIICNYVAIMCRDSSIESLLVRGGYGWRYCNTCKSLAPPRSWHCTRCNVCIVKRDHHCMFSGYCIGHHNQRYFLMFICYSALAAFVINIYGTIFLWRLLNKALQQRIPYEILRLFCNWHFCAYGINMLSLFFAMKLLFFYIPLACRGGVVFDRFENTYDEGCLKNIKSILGKRFYLVWINPLIPSALPSDGTQWTRRSRRQ